MPFVKLDCDIVNSTIWFDLILRNVFLTCLLMAEPREFAEPVQQICVDSLEFTGWEAPPGWYGFVPASGPGIAHQAHVDRGKGIEALRSLGEPEADSRSSEHEGRRVIRCNGGYLILNYQKYREKDYTCAERSKRYREHKASRRSVTDERRDVTQAEAEAEAEEQKQKPTPYEVVYETLIPKPAIELPDWLPSEAWDNFKAHRAANRKRHGPLTDRAERIALKALSKLRDKGYDPVEIVERTIVSGWASFFEPYPQNGNKSQTRGNGFLDIDELKRRKGASDVPHH